MSRIVTFGEIMLRLNPEGYQRILQADRFEISFAGGEANVAAALSVLGMDAAFVSKVPPHEVGQSAINALRRYGVDTRQVIRGGERLGV
jgi:2-dehydro-3-deoxygluconokinase